MAQAASLILLSMIKNRVRQLKVMSQCEPCVLTSRFQLAQASALHRLIDGFSALVDFDDSLEDVFLLRFTPLVEKHEVEFWQSAEQDMIKLRSMLAKIAKQNHITPQISAEMIERKDLALVSGVYALMDYTVLVIKAARIMKRAEKTFVFTNHHDLFTGASLVMSELKHMRSHHSDMLASAIRNAHVRVDLNNTCWDPSMTVAVGSETCIRAVNPTALDSRYGRTADELALKMRDLRAPLCADDGRLVEAHSIAQDRQVQILIDGKTVASFGPGDYVGGHCFSESYLSHLFHGRKSCLSSHDHHLLRLRVQAFCAAAFNTFTRVGDVVIVGHNLSLHKDQEFLGPFIASMASKVDTARQTIDHQKRAEMHLEGKITEKNHFWTEGLDKDHLALLNVPAFNLRRQLFLKTF